ncbi:MAG: hypothetical protein AB7O24_07125 [Kofleriaceae bacterium]
MADDERTRRRLGDETKHRIEDLASGWTVDEPSATSRESKPATPAAPIAEGSEVKQPATADAPPRAAPPPAAGAPAPRNKPKTLPPPPPGSPERKALETAIVDNKPKDTSPPPVPVAKADSARITVKPPLPVTAATAAPFTPVTRATRETGLPDESGDRHSTVSRAETPLVIEANPSAGKAAIAAARTIDYDATMRAEASREPSSDPTTVSPADAPSLSVDSTIARRSKRRLRTIAALRRKRGWFGDLRYVFTALFGVRRSRRELGELEHKRMVHHQSRRRHLVTLGRTAVTTEGLDHVALSEARGKLGAIEDERAKHTGQVAAAEQELARIQRERDTAAKLYATQLESADAELAELDKRLEPLMKEHAALSRRGADLRASVKRLEQQIAVATDSVAAAMATNQDVTPLQAELATLKADRKDVVREEPVLATELDSLNPRIAEVEAKRTAAQHRRDELVKTEQNDQRRTEELLVAIGAKRKVMDRAVADAEEQRDKIFFEVGERLYVDRPGELTAQLHPIDSIDVELGTSDRRMMELREILSTIDKAKLARGIAMLLMILGVAGVIVWFALLRT